MKKFLIILLMLSGIISAYPVSFGTDDPESGYEFPLDVEDLDKDDKSKDEPPIEFPPRRHRMPGLHLYCEISRENGVTISRSGVSESIVSYEIYDSAGCCVAVFADEQDFIDFIFSGISGEFLLRFRTPDITYSGIICL